nr:sensor histidine kinase [Bacteroidia bacterium]
GGIEIEVQDLGIGISSDSQRKVFDKFYRVPTGNVHDVKGFGIGLSYALSMAKAHGGDIRLRSEVGRGSTFTLFLPQKTAIA